MADRSNEMLQNYRGRRLVAYEAAEKLWAVIDALGVDDGRYLPIPDHAMPAAPTDMQKAELKNMATSLLRMILLHNDGYMSPQTLRSF